MAVWTLGINHTTAPLDLRGRFAFALDQIEPNLRGLRQSLSRMPEAAIVSTCNRTEIYCAGEHSELEPTLGWLAHSAGISADALRSYTYSLQDDHAARHAFRVASGLDSMVLGEPQILGQLKDAVRAAEAAGALGTTSAFLSHLFPAEKILYVLANLVLVALGLHLAGIWSGVLILEAAGGGVWKRLQPVFKKLVPIQTVPQAFAAGMVWGWLPCGLVYSVLIAALASGSALQGGLTMLAFGLGTLPNLLLMGLFASQLQRFLGRRGVRLAAGLIIVALGLFGLARAL